MRVITQVLFCISFLFCSFTQAEDLTFRRYLPDQVITLDPIRVVDRYSQSVTLQLYSTLFKTTDGVTPSPHLVKSFQYDAKQNVYHLQLRQDVFFHNGLPFTADDVVFTFKRLCQHKGGSLRVLPLIRGCGSQVDIGVKQQGEYQVSIHLKKSYPPFLSSLAGPEFMILPNRLSGLSEKEFFKKPIGTGPYTLENWQKNVISLASNRHYFLGEPQVKKIVNYMEPTQKIYDRLKKGEIDDIFPLASPKEFSNQYHSVFVNTANSMILSFSPKVKPFDNMYLRKALRAAIDNQEINNKLKEWSGVVPAHGVVPWGAIGFDQNIPNSFYDLNKVQEFVQKAGYKAVSDVPEFVIRSVLKAPFDQSIPALVVNSLKKHGFKVRLVQINLSELIADIKEQRAGAILAYMTMATIDTYDFLSLWKSDFPNAGLMAYDQEFDNLLEQALGTPDRLLRQKLYQRANRRLVEQAYFHGLAHVVGKKSLRKKGWDYPRMGFTGPFFYNLAQLNYDEPAIKVAYE